MGSSSNKVDKQNERHQDERENRGGTSSDCQFQTMLFELVCVFFIIPLHRMSAAAVAAVATVTVSF